MANNESFLWGLVRNIREKRNKRKMLKNISIQNQNNKKIIQYQPSEIEAFFSNADPLGNILISGGAEHLRSRAIVGYIESVLTNGAKVVVLHVGDTDLENNIVQHFNNAVLFNRKTSIYEPLLGLSNAEICRILLSSATKSSEIHSGGQYYIEGITEFIRSKKVSPYCEKFITCPHLDLFDKVNDAEAKGLLNSTVAQRIKTMLMQGQTQRSDIENYFNVLRHQAQGLLVSKSNLKQAKSLRQTLNRGELAVFDIGANINDLLLNIALNDLMSVAKGGEIVLILDGITISASEQLENIIKNSGVGLHVVLSSNDTYAAVNADDKIFASIVGKSLKSIIFHHSSVLTCNKWAEIIGYYEKKEVSDTLTSGKNYQSMFSIIPGQAKSDSVNISLKRDFIIRPEEISHMTNDEVYILDAVHNELIHAIIV